MKIRFDTRGNDKQKQAAAAWINPEITDILYGGSKGSGKSYLGAALIFGDALMYPGTHYFIARHALNDLRKFTIPTIDEALTAMKITPRYYRFNGHDNFYAIHNGSKVFLLEAKYMPSDEEYQRFGSMQMTRGWIEEAGEVVEKAKKNLFISCGRWKNQEYNLAGKLFMTCNPSKNFLYREYYKKKKEGKLEPWKRYIQALPTDNKMLGADYLRNLERELTGAQKERLLKGNWEYDDDGNVMMRYEKITDLFSNRHVAEGKKYITVDAARMGGDKIVMCSWSGFHVRIKWWKTTKLDESAKLIEAERNKMGIGKSEVLIDEDGLGGGLVDFMKYKGFVNNSRPLASPTGPKDQKTGKPIPENYDNLKSQCYFHFSDRVNAGNVYIESVDEEINQMIVDELEQIKAKDIDSDMKKGVIPKDEMKEALGHSPDFADAMMMREWFELRPKLTWTSLD